MSTGVSIVAIAQVKHQQAMEQLAAMRALVVAKHIAESRGSDDLLPFHDTAPHMVDIKRRRTLCNVRLSDCMICDRIVFPYRDDSNYDVLIPDLGNQQPCETCRERFHDQAGYDEWVRAIRDHQHLLELADCR